MTIKIIITILAFFGLWFLDRMFFGKIDIKDIDIE
jgi:hypothetical protein